MGRKKQTPRRAGGIIENGSTSNSGDVLKNPLVNCPPKFELVPDIQYFVDVDKSRWDSIDHRDISEIVVSNLNFSPDFVGFKLDDDICFRFKLCNVNEQVGRIKLGHWPVISSEIIFLEFLQKRVVGKIENWDVVVSGQLDGSDEGVTGLVHLVSLKYLTLRPVKGFAIFKDVSSVRVRVEVLQSAFDACETLLDNSRQLWKKSMMNVMAWVRPEVTTSEVRYGFSSSSGVDVDMIGEGSCGDSKTSNFDVSRFYEAIKRSKGCPMLDVELPGLIPELRPYQRRAAYWMVQREKADLKELTACEKIESCSPLCVPVKFLDTSSKMFYNPFSGSISMYPDIPSSYVCGGILADEMGLGKTVELLACVLAHRKSSSGGSSSSTSTSECLSTEKVSYKRVKRERVECICGALSESYRYTGLWVQCDMCDAWQHADCVGYSPSGSRKSPKQTDKGQPCDDKKRKRDATDIVMMDGEYVCQLCSVLIQATGSPIDSGATLIVCPAPILLQWHTEILRHTNSGSLKIYIYEGVRDISLGISPALDIDELASADIVLTTYDVLKDDLSHDSERHEGDRRIMRYEKRYPVVPTLLTRVSWWRVCLDEAQMVESNVGPATEMALRLHAKHRWCITGTPIQRKLDDLYYLLRFLKANPFDVFRWWTEVIREPYERRDVAAIKFTQQLFRQLMWRSSKSHVVDELQLPAQGERVLWLSFSPVEEHFYQRQHESCLDVAREVVGRFKREFLMNECSGSHLADSVPDPLITHLEAEKLLNTLLKLRQACCHPQVGGSGLRSLQNSPLTMDEVLSVLISKTKLEGEDALRKVISSLNGLAGIAVIRGELTNAVSLYKEALDLAEDLSEDFRLDPLLDIHIHHNLAEILKSDSPSLREVWLCEEESGENPKKRHILTSGVSKCGLIKPKQGVTIDESIEVAGETWKASEMNFNSQPNGLTEESASNIKLLTQYTSEVENLINVCGSIKQRYLSGFYVRLSHAQEEFRKSYKQVCNSFSDKDFKDRVWWLEALQRIKQKKEVARELSQKIENAILLNQSSSKAPNIAARFETLSTLQLYIQNGLDSLEASRKKLIDHLLEIDQRMENPRDEDFEHIRFCSGCNPTQDGPLCVHCELDESFQAYEARLFLKRHNDGNVIESAEEALQLKKRNLDRNSYYSNLEQKSQNIERKRDIAKMLVVSRSPSEVEIILGVLRSYFRTQLGREGISDANKHLVLFEGMRKEFAHARSLATIQAQVFRAYDELKMATSRLRVKENDDDNSIDAVSLEQLDIASVENSSEKFVSMEALSRIRGKLRYLQGLVNFKQKVAQGSPTENGSAVEGASEVCPVCQETLQSQRMVFQCGHVTCCKCLFAITESSLSLNGKVQNKWLLCPTCRQHSDFQSIAFVDDQPNASSRTLCESFEAAVSVQGSYGTKIEAITRRILWIKSTDPNAKVLVFSSWNDVLDVLQHAFAANEISFVRMKGGRKRSQHALSIFKGETNADKISGNPNNKQKQDSEFVQVLLLLIQHGANGLNLLEAQHVILVEPLLNPAAEAQAISRVHRVGQTRETLIHRFIVKNTVEESLYNLNKSRNSSSFISGNKQNRDQPLFTVKDIESLFAAAPPDATVQGKEHASNSTNDDAQARTATNSVVQTGSLTHLPPSVAAAIAAERRLGQC